jgi:hypothetical protein
MGRAVIVILIAVAVVVVFAVESGSVPRAAELVERLATRPEVGDRFDDPESGRFDATVFLFTCVLMAPFAVIAGGLAVAVYHAVLEATVLPLGRRVGLPDGAVVSAVTLMVSGVAWVQAELWVPRSVSLLALIARAWVVSTT